MLWQGRALKLSRRLPVSTVAGAIRNFSGDSAVAHETECCRDRAGVASWLPEWGWSACHGGPLDAALTRLPPPLD